MRITRVTSLAMVMLVMLSGSVGSADTVALEETEVRTLTLQECIDIALEGNHRRPISQFGVMIAEAQHKQALSSYWPTLMLKSMYMRLEDDPDFTYPATSFTVPGGTIPTQPMLVNIPAGAFGPGFPAADLQLPVQPPPITTPDMHLNVPPTKVTVMDRSTWASSLSLTYPLYTGGLRKSLVDQARAGIDLARQEARRTDLQIIYDVKRMYCGALLARELMRTGQDALARLEVTLRLTESLYKNGSGRVKKTDWLRNKMVVESLQSIIATVDAREKSARAALVNTMALPWDTEIALAATEIPNDPYEADLEKLVSSAYRFNPDWSKLAAGLRGISAQVDEARSEDRVKIALTGSLHYVVNSLDTGILGDDVEKSWSAGVGLELPIFDGFLSRNKVREAQARLGKIMTEKRLLRDGIALQVKHVFLTMTGAQRQLEAAAAALETASQNRDLNERAYQDELVETEDVIEAQIMESFAEARYLMSLYQHATAQAELDFIIGSEVRELLLADE